MGCYASQQVGVNARIRQLADLVRGDMAKLSLAFGHPVVDADGGALGRGLRERLALIDEGLGVPVVHPQPEHDRNWDRYQKDSGHDPYRLAVDPRPPSPSRSRASRARRSLDKTKRRRPCLPAMRG